MLVKLVRDDVEGVVLPYVAVTLGVIIGLAALALDGSRLMSMQTQLQNGADALALAGATELDRRPDSILRAEAAIRNLVTNPVEGGGIGELAQVSSVQFLQSLPPNDDLPITTANVTEDPTLAAYVDVTVKPVALHTVFPVALLPGSHDLTVGAESVAGYDQIVCNAAPLLVCNPFETSAMSYFQATQALIAADQNPASQRQLIRLARSQFKNGGYTPGDFSYVTPATGFLPTSACGPGAGRGVPQAFAATRLRACYRLSRANLISSDDQAALDGLNTRFDIYANGFNACRIYPPDQNVRKGFTAVGNINWCNARPAAPNWPIATPDAAPLPPDQTMIAAGGQSFNPGISLGNGVWNCASYWSTAHFAGPGAQLPPAGCTAAASISRYDTYRYEMNFLSDRSRGVEIGAPQCAPPGADNRRIIIAAIVNCGSSPVPVLPEAQGVPIAGFGRFFLVWPAVAGSSNGNPYAEFLGLLKRSDPLSTDMVQLYR
jgi:hypothetical protein